MRKEIMVAARVDRETVEQLKKLERETRLTKSEIIRGLIHQATGAAPLILSNPRRDEKYRE